MLTLREEQVAVFGPLGKKALEDRMLEHLNRFFPEQCKALSEPKLRDRSVRHPARRFTASTSPLITRPHRSGRYDLSSA
jgi:hypothetical protein